MYIYIYKYIYNFFVLLYIFLTYVFAEYLVWFTHYVHNCLKPKICGRNCKILLNNNNNNNDVLASVCVPQKKKSHFE